MRVQSDFTDGIYASLMLNKENNSIQVRSLDFVLSCN